MDADRWGKTISDFVTEGEVPLNFVLLIETLGPNGRPRAYHYLAQEMLTSQIFGLIEESKVNMIEEIIRMRMGDDASQG